MKKDWLIAQLLKVVGKVVTTDTQKKAMDAYLDVIEDSIKDSPTNLDNTFVQPIITAIRNIFKIPDEDME